MGGGGPSSTPQDENPDQPPDEPDITFLQVEDAYPEHRRDTADAWIVWKQLRKRKALPGLMPLLESLDRWAQSEQWTKDGGRYVPMMSKWLRNQQFHASPRDGPADGWDRVEQWAREQDAKEQEQQA